MDNNLLDAADVSLPTTTQVVVRVIVIIVATDGSYFLLEMLRPYLPVITWTPDQVPVPILGMLYMIITTISVLLLTTQLNALTPAWTKLRVVVSVGTLAFVMDVLVRLLRNMTVNTPSWSQRYFMGAFLIGLFGMLLANVKIHRLRGQSALLPALLLLGIWCLVSFLF